MFRILPKTYKFKMFIIHNPQFDRRSQIHFHLIHKYNYSNSRVARVGSGLCFLDIFLVFLCSNFKPLDFRPGVEFIGFIITSNSILIS